MSKILVNGKLYDFVDETAVPELGWASLIRDHDRYRLALAFQNIVLPDLEALLRLAEVERVLDPNYWERERRRRG